MADPALLLRASDAPGILDGWCGPVVVEFRGRLTVGVANDGLRSFTQPPNPPRKRRGVNDWPTEETTFLDLALDEAADRAARWLAGAVMPPEDHGYVAECGAYWRGTRWTKLPGEGPDQGERRWVLGSWMGIATHTFVAEPSQLREVGRSGHHPDQDPEGTMPDPQWHVVPALASLDPADPRLLPSGARWVDRAALLACCVATRTP